MKLIEVKPDGTQIFLDDVCPRCGGAGAADKWHQTGKTCWDCGGTGKRTEPKRVTVYTQEKQAALDAKARARRQAKLIPDNRMRCGFDPETGIGYAYTGKTRQYSEAFRMAGGHWNNWIEGWIAPTLLHDLDGVKITRIDGADVLNENGYLQDESKLLAAMNH